MAETMLNPEDGSVYLGRTGDKPTHDYADIAAPFMNEDVFESLILAMGKMAVDEASVIRVARGRAFWRFTLQRKRP